MFLSLYFDYAWDGWRERSFVQRESREMRWGAWGFKRERTGIFMGIFVIHHQPNGNSSNAHASFDLWTSCGPQILHVLNAFFSWAQNATFIKKLHFGLSQTQFFFNFFVIWAFSTPKSANKRTVKWHVRKPFDGTKI